MDTPCFYWGDERGLRCISSVSDKIKGEAFLLYIEKATV